jgi:hypothetical protein
MVGEQSEHPTPSQETMGTFEETARNHLQRSLSATPAQRLAWLEEALELAYRTGALQSKTKNNDFGPEDTEKKQPVKLMTS